MSRKSFIIILGLSLVLTYFATFVDALVNSSLIGGQAGFPLKYSRATMFGEGTTNYFLMTINIVFWFLVIYGIWQIWKRFFKSSGFKKKRSR